MASNDSRAWHAAIFLALVAVLAVLSVLLVEVKNAPAPRAGLVGAADVLDGAQNTAAAPLADDTAAGLEALADDRPDYRSLYVDCMRDGAVDVALLNQETAKLAAAKKKIDELAAQNAELIKKQTYHIALLNECSPELVSCKGTMSLFKQRWGACCPTDAPDSSCKMPGEP